METKHKMIEEVLSNRFTTAAYLYQDENINHNQVSVDTLICEEGLGAYNPQLISLVTEINKAKPVQFCL